MNRAKCFFLPLAPADTYLPSYKLEKVEDALSVNDAIWVKVLEITREERDGRVRAKIRLSMKDAAQDGSGNDLGQERASSEAMKNQIAQTLNSTIGMGVALDPMAPSKNGNLVLKSDAARASTIINGYTLVGDDEGEPPSVISKPAPIVRSMGRGRGTTLPAWMTRTEDGLTKKDKKSDKKAEKRKRKDKKKEVKEERKRRKHEHKRDRSERHHSRRRRSYSSSSDEDRHRKRRRRDSSSDDDRRYDSEDGRVRHRQDRTRKPGTVGNDRKRRSASEDSRLPFQNVEEAKRLIAKLEAKQERTRL